jgi:hypothetical protein
MKNARWLCAQSRRAQRSWNKIAGAGEVEEKAATAQDSGLFLRDVEEQDEGKKPSRISAAATKENRHRLNGLRRASRGSGNTLVRGNDFLLAKEIKHAWA